MKCGHEFAALLPDAASAGRSPPLRKEVHYFDLNFARGEAWYRANFGRDGRAGPQPRQQPYYLFHPLVPQRAHALVPDAKLIVLLRDPVRRAYSHYWHERDKGRESLSFEDAIAAEPDTDRSRSTSGSRAVRSSAAQTHQYFSYLARGRYAEQLERWLRVLSARAVARPALRGPGAGPAGRC